MHDTTTTTAPLDAFPARVDCVITEDKTGLRLAALRVPASHPTSIGVRRLGWKALDAATEAKQAEAMRTLQRLIPAGADTGAIRDLVAGAARDGVARATAARQAAEAEREPVAVDDTPAAVDTAPAADASDPLDSYSVPVLLARGIVTLDGVAATTEALEDLSPDAALRTAAAILRLSAPEAYETEADRKNA
jgi:hypothetical protein